MSPSDSKHTANLTGLSSMATRALLAELTADCAGADGPVCRIEAVGGVDAARRVAAGERFDVVVLASDAIDRLVAQGRLGPRVDLVRSPVAVAVRAGTPRPDIASETALRQAVLGARSLCFSTGPSGVWLAQLFVRWGIADEIQPRLVQAPPGVPVGSLVARGDAELGFQQLSELMGVEGIEVLGTLPEACAFVTTFSAAPGLHIQHSPSGAAVQALLDFINSPQAVAVKQRHGMAAA